MARLDDVLLELAEIQVLLEELPGDEFSERVVLRERQQALRQEAAELRASLEAVAPLT